jgi:hypothetical protein
VRPTSAPHPAYTYQLHVGIPSHCGALVIQATIFDTSTPTIAPLRTPSGVVKQPMNRLRPRSGWRAISGSRGQYAASRRAARTRSAVCGSTKSSSAGA